MTADFEPNLVEEQVEHYQIGLEGGHTLCCAPVMLIFIATAIGFVLLSRYTNNTNAAQFHATTISELIVHATPVLGCVVIVMLDMSLRSSNVVIESV